MASGGIRSNYTAQDNITPGEARTLRHNVVDADGANVADFTGWTFSWFLLSRLGAAHGLTKLAAEALLEKTTAGGGITSSSPPSVDIALTAADTIALQVRTYAYELWRTDSGSERRLAYGEFVMVP